MSLSHHPKIVTNGLILNLDAANKKSYSGTGTNWYDLSRNKYTAIQIGASFPSFNSSTNDFTFNGTSQYLRVPFTGSITDHTVIAWCKLATLTPTGSSAGEGVVGIGVDGNQGPTGGFLTLVYNETTAKRWQNQSSNAIQAVVSSPDETSTSYLMMAITYTTNSYIIYRNGVVIGSSTAYSPYTFTNGQMIIGTRHFIDSNYTSVSNGYFNGNISVVQVYNRALTATEVLQNYNALKGRFGL